MWRETLRAQQEGKPVIASLGDVAGSGGYFIAMGADKIVAQPGTITGSIGVLSGKLVTQQLWEKLGISFDGVRTHRNADMWSGRRGFTPEQWESLEASLDRVYQLFTEGVALGRNLPLEQVLEAARGRIWTGADALELGLVDALGGFPEAIRLAKAAAGIDADSPVQLRLFPRARTPLELVVDALTGRAAPNGDAMASLVTGTLERLRPLGRVALQLGLVEPHGVLQMQIPHALLGP